MQLKPIKIILLLCPCLCLLGCFAPKTAKVEEDAKTYLEARFDQAFDILSVKRNANAGNGFAKEYLLSVKPKNGEETGVTLRYKKGGISIQCQSIYNKTTIAKEDIKTLESIISRSKVPLLLKHSVYGKNEFASRKEMKASIKSKEFPTDVVYIRLAILANKDSLHAETKQLMIDIMNHYIPPASELNFDIHFIKADQRANLTEYNDILGNGYMDRLEHFWGLYITEENKDKFSPTVEFINAHLKEKSY